MTRDRKSTGRNRDNRNTRARTHASSSGDDGCLVVLVLLLWYFGFISFHSRTRGRELDKLADVRTELSKAQVHLSQITKVANELQSEANVLDTRRTTLQRQVADLEHVRDEIGASLTAATQAVATPQRPLWSRWLEPIFTGVVGNIISTILISLATLFVGKRLWRHKKAPRDVSPGDSQ